LIGFIGFIYNQKLQKLNFMHPKGALIMTLTKANIVEAVAEQTGFTNKRSFEIVETLLKMIKSALESGEDVLISGFGKFCVKEKRLRRGRNPATGEDMMLVPRKVITFRCSKLLREKINGQPNLT
jgi:integration host factor subunit alpha